jgi:hypothetical protein
MGSIAICVLGQSLDSDGSIPPALLTRLRLATELHRDYPTAPLIVSGGDPADTGRTEAEAMYAFLIDAGVPPRCIVLEPLAQNTVQNALLVLPLVPAGASTLLLITSDFHMPRASYAFEAVIAASGRARQLRVCQHPVAFVCNPSRTGSASAINSQSCQQRLELELHMLQYDFVQRHLPLHGSAGDLHLGAVAPLQASRLQQAIHEVRVLLSSWLSPVLALPDEIICNIAHMTAHTDDMAAMAASCAQFAVQLRPSLLQHRSSAITRMQEKGLKVDTLCSACVIDGREKGINDSDCLTLRYVLHRQNASVPVIPLFKLHLGANNISDPGATALANAFDLMPSLKELWLYRNTIRCDGALAIASALSAKSAKGRCMQLARIGLHHNAISSRGAQGLAYAALNRPPGAAQLKALFLDGNPFDCHSHEWTRLTLACEKAGINLSGD